MKSLDGKIVAAKVQKAIADEVQKEIQAGRPKPGLAVVLVGDDPASQVYVGSKVKTCQALGFASFEHRLPATVDFESLKKVIVRLNQDSKVHGILVQLPLPKHLDESQVIALIAPEKDADCLTSQNVGKLFQHKQIIASCTPAGVMEILKHYNYKLEGLNAVVVGRSQIVGLPMAQLLIQANATVTIAHSRTKDLKALTQQADLVIAAIGKPQFFTGDYFKAGAIAVDVGIHRLENKKLCGDIQWDEISHLEACTPVPGGVGPMTIAMLMQNTFKLYKLSLPQAQSL
jgi:methylenetetrahydrofolate dehydrogenase (NADP+) / methenyltetrahydrofolate cyclohydrolase